MLTTIKHMEIKLMTGLVLHIYFFRKADTVRHTKHTKDTFIHSLSHSLAPSLIYYYSSCYFAYLLHLFMYTLCVIILFFFTYSV